MDSVAVLVSESDIQISTTNKDDPSIIITRVGGLTFKVFVFENGYTEDPIGYLGIQLPDYGKDEENGVISQFPIVNHDVVFATFRHLADCLEGSVKLPGGDKYMLAGNIVPAGLVNLIAYFMEKLCTPLLNNVISESLTNEIGPE